MSKTITIDEEAYKILKSHKVDNESFSDVIKKQMVLPAYLQTPQQLESYFESIRSLTKKKKRHGAPR